MSHTRFNLASLPAATLLGLSTLLPAAASANGNKEGLDVKVRAENRSTADTPQFCPGIGAGSTGDRLDLDVSTDANGVTAGTAIFTAADGTATVMTIDKSFVYFGGLALMESSTRNTIAIWLGNAEEGGPNYNPVHVNVEMPRGCSNTVSTFTVNADKVTTQIKFQ